VVIERLRSELLPATLALAFVVAITLIWAASAESKAGKPVPTDRIADVQLLGVNDFHGNLEPPRTIDGRTVGGAAYLDAYMDKYEATN
jgi:5'-nucleotidase